MVFQVKINRLATFMVHLLSWVLQLDGADMQIIPNSLQKF